MTREECSATCRHASIRRRTDVTCNQYIETGKCEGGDNSTLARWGYHQFTRRCVPFYYTGCGGNNNNFLTQAECEDVCPTTFSPVISFNDGNTVFINRNQSEAVISVNVRANPIPEVQWSFNGRNISKFDSQVIKKYQISQFHKVFV